MGIWSLLDFPALNAWRWYNVSLVAATLQRVDQLVAAQPRSRPPRRLLGTTTVGGGWEKQT